MIIRACELKVGDRFINFGIAYIVVRIENGFIYAKYDHGGSRLTVIGWRSQQLLELITKTDPHG